MNTEGHTERVGSDSGGESCSIFFPEVAEIADLTNRKNECKKICNTKPLSHRKSARAMFMVKVYASCDQLCTL